MNVEIKITMISDPMPMSFICRMVSFQYIENFSGLEKTSFIQTKNFPRCSINLINIVSLKEVKVSYPGQSG
jgi:hypothetical protein